MSRWKRSSSVAGVVLVVVAVAYGAVPVSAGTPVNVPVVSCAKQQVTLARGVTLTCRKYTLADGSSFPAHVVSLNLAARPTLDVVPANNTVWQYRGENLLGYTPDAPVSAMLPRNGVVAVNGGYFDIKIAGSFSGTACSGMVRDGRILKTPARMAQQLANLVQFKDGHVAIGRVGFTGSISAAGTTIPLTSINDLADAGPQQRCPPRLDGNNAAAGNGVTMVTPDMGPVVLAPTTGTAPNAAQFQLPNALVVSGVRSGQHVRVTRVVQHTPASPLASLPGLTGNQVILVTSTPAQIAWLSSHAIPGQVLAVSSSLTVTGKPTSQIRTMVGGGAMLMAYGTVCPVSNTNTAAGCGGSFPLGDGGATSPHQETMVGVSANGRSVLLVTVDQLSATNGGISPNDDGKFMKSLGAFNAVLFDGGGSTTMVGRLPRSSTPVLLSAPNYSSQDPAGPDNQRYVSNAIVVRGGEAGIWHWR
jgi:hypothetical protein